MDIIKDATNRHGKNNQLSILQRLFTPSVFDLIIVSSFLLFLIADPLISCFDIWWHMKTGELIFNGQFPKTDIYSFTAFGKPWILHECGSELIFYLAHRIMGIPGLILLKSFVCALSFGITFRVMLAKQVNILVSFLFTLIIILGTASSWTVRPHLFTDLFLVLVFFIYTRFRHCQETRILRWLPALFCLWINLHGGFVIGFVFLAVCIVCELTSTLTARQNNTSLSLSAIRSLTFYTLLSFLACFFNPNTWKGVAYPLLYIGDKMPSNFITEWVPSSLGNHIEFVGIIFLIIMGLAWNRKKLFLYETGLLVVFTYFAFSATRHISLFALITAPIIAPLWQDIIPNAFMKFKSVFKPSSSLFFQKIEAYCIDRSNSFFHLEKRLKYHPIPIVLIVLAVLAAATGWGGSYFGIKADRYPGPAVLYLKKEIPKGNIFNQYAWGGFLIWHLPEKKVFIDGRLDVYQKEFSEPYTTVINLEEGWQKILTLYNISTILVNKKTILSRFLLQVSDEWRLVMDDDTTTLFQKKENNSSNSGK